MLQGEQACDGKTALGTQDLDSDEWTQVRKCKTELRDGSEARGPRVWYGNRIIWYQYQMAESRTAADSMMAELVNDIMQHGLGRNWDAVGTRLHAADTYTMLGTKDTTRRGSGSEGWCGKRESE